MIPLPKLPTYHDSEWIEIDHAELQRIQREAMRAALEHAALAGPAFEVYCGPDSWLIGHDKACKDWQDSIRALRIEGEQP